MLRSRIRLRDARLTSKIKKEAGKSSGKPTPRPATIQSVSTAIRVLNVLADAPHAMALGDLAREAGIGRSTAHRYLQSLLKEGMVQQDTVSGHYDLGPMALSIGTAALKRVDAVEIAARHMRQLAQDHAVSAGVAVWTDRGPTLVRWFRSAHLAINPVGLGDVLPLDNTACGLVFQAFLPAARITTARENQKPFFQGQPPSPAQLQEAERLGWAQRSNHLLPNIAGQAAIILDAQQEVACAVTSFADIGGMRGEDDSQLLLRAAQQINLETGGQLAGS